MNDTKEDVAWLGIRFLDILLHRFAQRSVASLIALNNLPTFLRYNDDMVVLVYYLHSLSNYSPP